MTLGVRLPSTSSGRRIQRYKTAGPGTLRVLDFKNPNTYPSSVVPTTSIPNGTALLDLPDASVATPSHPGAAVGSTLIQEAGGGIAASWSSTEHIQLPDDFKIPAMNGASGRYLIILGFKPTLVTAPPAAERIAGYATDSSANCNWLIYRNASNANYFIGVGSAFAGVGALSAGYHRIAIEVIKDSGAGTVQANAYVDAAKVATGTPVSLSALPQPLTTARLGAYGAAGGLASGGAFGSAEVRNLTTDIAAGLTVESILAADYAAWKGRFS